MNPARLLRRAARRVPRTWFRWVFPAPVLRVVYRFWISVIASDRDRTRAVRELLVLEDMTRRWLDVAAIAYDGGVHAKHRLTRYHDFFVERVQAGERVLDIGTGKGELAYDLVVRAGAVVVGIDNDPVHLSFARDRFRHERLRFEAGDVLERLPEGRFDVIVLSNVLEHVADRVRLLQRLIEHAQPNRFLVRVPVYARDWAVPLREEVGLPHFSDPGHHVEYDVAGFTAELEAAGLRITTLHQAWGEIWAVAERADG